ncbi:MAG: hypothetical protein ABSB71_08955 [Candidatus Bathyarchaeia archaeon]|jgi:hypothetical protein
MVEIKSRVKTAGFGVENTVHADGPCNGSIKSKKAEMAVRLNLTLRGETARILIELKANGIVRSYADCVNQSIRLFYEKVTKEELQSARAKVLRNSFGDDGS